MKVPSTELTQEELVMNASKTPTVFVEEVPIKKYIYKDITGTPHETREAAIFASLEEFFANVYAQQHQAADTPTPTPRQLIHKLTHDTFAQKTLIEFAKAILDDQDL